MKFGEGFAVGFAGDFAGVILATPIPYLVNRFGVASRVLSRN